MKNAFLCTAIVTTLAACNSNSPKNFTINCELKNAPATVVYLEQISYDNMPPQVVDSATITNGTFILKGKSTEESLLQIRFPQQEKAPFYFVITDASAIELKGDWNDISKLSFKNSPASERLRIFVDSLSVTQQKIFIARSEMEQNATQPDSIKLLVQKNLEQVINTFTSYAGKVAAEDESPMVSMFAVSLNTGKDLTENEAAYNNLLKRFPKHAGIQTVVKQFRDGVAAQNKKEEINTKQPEIGSIAPEIALPDVNGKNIALSSFRGKYVLVDFWASWCAPCRAENPNVVGAYNKYKNKNFTILGVSLDNSKDAWVKAIKDDGLAWSNISELDNGQNTAIGLYGFRGIPYNVLIDPTGKIIADNLRGNELERKLEEVLK